MPAKCCRDFAVPASIRATVAIETQSVDAPTTSSDILPGTDPVLKNEYIVVSAHLDHLGIGTMAGDAIYNGAMDNASGMATLDRDGGRRGGEEGIQAVGDVPGRHRGREGAARLALLREPTDGAGAASIVANLNTDMFLPLFPLHSLIVQGLEESDLAGDLRKTARPLGIEVYSDPEPERNAFMRSDQVQLHPNRRAVDFAEGRDSRKNRRSTRWSSAGARSDTTRRRTISRSRSTARLRRTSTGSTSRSLEAVANRPTRPAWNSDSFFRRFAK